MWVHKDVTQLTVFHTVLAMDLNLTIGCYAMKNSLKLVTRLSPRVW